MKIGLYKPFFPALFKDDDKDFNATSYEVVNVAKIFADHGDEVKILSKTDLKNGEKVFGDFNHKKNGSITKGSIEDKFDRIILYGGPWKDDMNTPRKLREKTKRLDFLLTDIRTIPPNESDWKLFDNFYSQSTKDELFGQKNIYGGVAEFRCYNMKLPKITEELVKNKGIRMYFGGTTRNRFVKYKHYVWNHKKDWVVTGKSDELGFNNRVSRSMFKELLSQTKFSLTFTDVDYEENNFITPRHYEHIENSIIGFADVDWDKDEHIMKMDDFRRVRTYRTLKSKIEAIEGYGIREHISLLKDQQKEILPEYKDGSYVYGRLK